MTTDRDRFVSRYSGIYEHSPWVAERAYEQASGVKDAEQLAGFFAASVDEASDEEKLALIRAHPDLAGKAALRGDLAADSTEEQARAGLDCCSAEELAEFRQLNRRYKERFGFPFVMAVRNSSRQEILQAFARRCDNSHPTELATAIAEIHKIASMRLKALDGTS